MWRVVRVMLILTNPTTALLSAVTVLVGTRSGLLRRVRGWWVVLAGLGWLMAGSLLGLGRGYVQPWRDLAAAIPRQFSATTRPDAGGVLDLVAERWLAWLLGQVPIGVAFALIVAGLVMMRRQRYAAAWREDPEPAWDTASTRRVAAGHAKAERTPLPDTRSAFADLRMPLGVDARAKPVALTGAMMIAHMVVTGPTGYGKTTTLLRLVHGWLVRWAVKELPAVVFDFKGDPALRAELEAMAAATGRQVHTVTLSAGSTTYNPLRHGSAEEVAARIIETLANADGGGFTEPHHRIVGERWLTMCMLALDALVAGGSPRDGRVGSAPWTRTLADLAALMPPAEVTTQLARLTGLAQNRARRLLGEVQAEKDLLRSILGMTQRVALLTEQATGPILVDEPDGLDLYQVVAAGDLALFSLSSQANPAAARAIGNLAVADLSSMFGRLLEEGWARRTDRRVLVVLDEFTGLGGSLLSGLLERARSAGGSLVLSTQTDGGFTAVSEEFAEAVWSNSNMWVLHRQVGESAAARAEAIGTRSAWMETVQVTEDTDLLGSTTGGSGTGSLRKVERFVVHPNELKRLDVGQVVFVCWSPYTAARVRVTRLPEQAPAVGPAVVSSPAPVPPAGVPAQVGSRVWTDDVDW
ncbi:MAG: type IV secretory system conjugative DNA transfer family protein [Phycicoccus sp.]